MDFVLDLQVSLPTRSNVAEHAEPVPSEGDGSEACQSNRSLDTKEQDNSDKKKVKDTRSHKRKVLAGIRAEPLAPQHFICRGTLDVFT
jgi:hypothetical protein